MSNLIVKILEKTRANSPPSTPDFGKLSGPEHEIIYNRISSNKYVINIELVYEILDDILDDIFNKFFIENIK
jgi:hypothetical protein